MSQYFKTCNAYTIRNPDNGFWDISELLRFYREVKSQKTKSYQTLLPILHHELTFFIKLKHFWTKQVGLLSNLKCDVIAQGIRNEFTLDSFDILLQAYFDALMEESEGNVKMATDNTKNCFNDIENWTHMMTHRVWDKWK